MYWGWFFAVPWSNLHEDDEYFICDMESRHHNHEFFDNNYRRIPSSYKYHMNDSHI